LPASQALRRSVQRGQVTAELTRRTDLVGERLDRVAHVPEVREARERLELIDRLQRRIGQLGKSRNSRSRPGRGQYLSGFGLVGEGAYFYTSAK